MSEHIPDNEQPAVLDLDDYSKKKAILLGAAVTLLLSFVPYSWVLLFGHLGVGGLTAAGYFAKSNQISFTFGTGAKMGALAALLGTFVFYLLGPARAFTMLSEEEWNELKQPYIEQFYQQGQPEVATQLENMAYGDIKPFVLGMILLLLLALAAIGGALGGGLGAVFFKKGPEAR